MVNKRRQALERKNRVIGNRRTEDERIRVTLVSDVSALEDPHVRAALEANMKEIQALIDARSETFQRKNIKRDFQKIAFAHGYSANDTI